MEKHTYFFGAVTIRNYLRTELWDMLAKLSAHQQTLFTYEEIDAELNRRNEIALAKFDYPYYS